MKKRLWEYLALLVLAHVAAAMQYGLWASSMDHAKVWEFVPLSATAFHVAVACFSIPLVCSLYHIERSRNVNMLNKSALLLLLIFVFSSLALIVASM